MGDTVCDKDSIRRPRKALNNKFVHDAARAGKYFDGNGLFLRVMPSGSKQWVQRIVIQGKRTELGLGGAELITLPEARAKALENRRVSTLGGNPLVQRRSASLIPCFEDAAVRVHAMHAPTHGKTQNTRHSSFRRFRHTRFRSSVRRVYPQLIVLTFWQF